MRKSLVTAIAACALGIGSAPALAAPIDCGLVTTIGAWKAATGGCIQGDKLWTIGTTSLSDSVQVLFGSALLTHNMQIVGFDTSNAANSWTISYDILVTDPADFYISDMFAGADNPGGGSLLTKAVSGDPGGPFTLTDVNGVEGPSSEKHGLTSTALHIDETFSVDAGANLLSVSNTYLEKARAIPTPGTLALLGLGLVAMGAVRRRRDR